MSRLLDPARFNAEKLLWQRLVLQDPSLNAFAKVLAAFLTHYLNERRGGAWLSQPELARRLGVDVRTIRRATADLVEARWLTVTVSKGRGRSNVYRAILDATSDIQQKALHLEEPTSITWTPLSGGPDGSRPQTTVGDRENGTPLSKSDTDNGTSSALKPDNLVPPILIETNSPLPPKNDTDRMPLHSRSGNLGQPGAGWGVLPRQCFPEDAVRSALLAAKGRDFVWSYLDQASWHAEQRAISCLTKFAAQKLRTECSLELSRLGVTVNSAQNVRTQAEYFPMNNFHSPRHELSLSGRDHPEEARP